MRLNQELSQKQTLSVNMMQSMEILQMNAQELEKYIEDLAVDNPVIDLPDSSSQITEPDLKDRQRKLTWLESSDFHNRVAYHPDQSSEDMEQNWYDKREQEIELREFLLSQLPLFQYSPKEKEILEFLIYSLDAQGYLKEPLSFIAENFSVPDSVILALLKEIQALDPPGVGARDLKECLLLQLQRKSISSPLAAAIVNNHLNALAKNHLTEIAKKMQVPINQVIEACKEIRTLNPKPGNSFSNREQLRYIVPDVIVVKLESSFEILINESQYPHFSINAYYQNLLKTTPDLSTRQYLQKKITQAQWVQNCISQRTSTLDKVMHIIVEKQKDFFSYGIGYKHPLKLKDISIELDVHESTVSRALREKYLQCAWGIFPLNYFLTSAAAKSEENEEKTPEQIKQFIQTLIDNEDKKAPLSDQKISDKLNASGIKISRRTINKYRTEMGIPDKNGRVLSK